MVPRRAVPRAGFRRIDAALDALLPMGFSESKISRTVKNLLRNYGGDDGWPFIEEFSYQLVIDTMIEEGENCPAEDAEAGAESSGERSSVKDDDEEAGEHDSNSQHVMQVEALPADLPPSIDTPSSMEVQDARVQFCHTGSLPKMDNTKPRALRNIGASQDKLCLTPDVPRPSRRPCYGWISSDDEEDDLVYSEPAR